ncbi:hypothetical protein DASB73_035490 [Starmerella bacillaris]|uniref:COX assembly mitochondrial protein n=1 Tax=Starmerella bacillaris TaxID=1247836 RepID=A0AAV5RPI7_STABA|nr:hypothetical protein DASB73_035490 [Starmerella bacillaris]
MSNKNAMDKCMDLINALEECRSQANIVQKATGKCFELEKLARVCRHEARLEDRKTHVAQALEKSKRQKERWNKIQSEEES